MWVDVKSKQHRGSLVEDYLARRNRLRQRFDNEKVGVTNLQFEAAKLFKPITTTQQQETIKQATGLNKLTDALQHLPARLVDETNYSPIAALFGDEEAAHAAPALAPIATAKPRRLPPAADPPLPSPTLTVDPNRELKTDIIKKYHFKLPNELNLLNTKEVLLIADEITDFYRRTLGREKKQAKATGDAKGEAKLDTEIKAMAAYRDRLRLLAEWHRQLIEPKIGKSLQLKVCGDRFGDLTIDPTALAGGQVKAFEGGHLVFKAPSDEILYDLLTKRFVKTKQYTPQAVKIFTELVKLAGLPVHGRKSNKHKLIRGAGQQVLYYNDPNTLVERLQLLAASKHTGNTGVDVEISAILDELMHTGAISREQGVQLNTVFIAMAL